MGEDEFYATVITDDVRAHMLRQPIQKTFKPELDITAYELAALLPYFHGRPIYQEDLDALGSAARHLT